MRPRQSWRRLRKRLWNSLVTTLILASESGRGLLLHAQFVGSAFRNPRRAAGCLALIRDGATLARGPADVLEALGRLNLVAPMRVVQPPRDAAGAAVLLALESGPLDFDRIVAESGISAPAALAALSCLELEGAVESRGATSYARVGVLPGGEEHAR